MTLTCDLTLPACLPVTNYPIKSRPQGYIVNVNRHDAQGSHWLGVWTNDDTMMDSFGMDMARYDIPWFEKWTLQAINSQSCGMYVLAFLVTRAMGISMDGYLSMFTTYDSVKKRSQDC